MLSKYKKKQLKDVARKFLEKFGEPTEKEIMELAYFWKVPEIVIKVVFKEAIEQGVV